MGLDKFREHFAEHADHYAVIGGTACSMILEEVGIGFRQTDDIDMVLCVEVVDPSFAQSLKAFLDGGGYHARERSNGRMEYYRFHKPTDPSYPAMLELFARKPEALEIPEDAGLTVVEVSDESLSLSAILLDTDYYEALLANRRPIDDILVLMSGCLSRSRPEHSSTYLNERMTATRPPRAATSRNTGTTCSGCCSLCRQLNLSRLPNL